MVDKDKVIVDLKAALDTCRKELSDFTAVQEKLVKTKTELNLSRRAAKLSEKKIEFARKITEQRMSNSISGAGFIGQDEEELITLILLCLMKTNLKLILVTK